MNDFIINYLETMTSYTYTRAPLHKTMVTLQLMISLQSMVTTIAILLHSQSKSKISMIVTIDCRDIINCKVTIVLCNGAQVPKKRVLYFGSHLVSVYYYLGS